jgi:hypothetical protein
MENRCFKNDLEYGLTKENEVMDTLKEYFEPDIEKTELYCVWDAHSPKSQTRYEIKSRRCKYSTYPTTIIPYKKRNGAVDGKRLLFVFCFTDGLYYSEFDKNVFDSFDTRYITYYRPGIIPKPVKHYCIPCEMLSRIVI